jgi:hypothetical protein
MGDLSKNVTGISLLYNAIISIVLLCVVTFGHNKLAESPDYKRNIIFILIGYWTITLILQIFLNMFIKFNTCNKNLVYYKDVFIMTIIPWFIILGTFMILLLFIPGLLRVFSNTIGMSLMYRFYKTNIEIDMNKPTDTVEINQKIYQMISKDPAIIINEIEYTNDASYEETYKSYQAQFPYLFTETPESKINIKKLIISKNIIGYAIWIALISSITSINSINNILNLECN